MGRSSKFAELAAAYDTGGALSFRNKLINAAFTINQRGYVTGTSTSTANQYTLDRWRIVTSGQSLAFSATGGVFTVTAPAGGIEQVIEGINLTTGSYVLSWTGTATATVGGAAVVKGGTVSVTGDSNLTIRFSGGTVSQPQFEQGIEPTPFENRPIGLELSLCQRYCPVWTATLVNHPIGVGQVYSSTSAQFPLPYPVTPRVAATGITTTGTFNVLNSTAVGITATLTINMGSLAVLNVIGATAGGLVAGNSTLLAATSPNTRIIGTGCEL